MVHGFLYFQTHTKIFKYGAASFYDTICMGIDRFLKDCPFVFK